MTQKDERSLRSQASGEVVESPKDVDIARLETLVVEKHALMTDWQRAAEVQREMHREELDALAVAMGIRKGLPIERLVVWAKASGDMVREAWRERDEAKAERDALRAQLARAVFVWPQDAMVRIRECIADPSRMGPREDETVAGWGARAVIKLMESWRAPVSESVPATPEPVESTGLWQLEAELADAIAAVDAAGGTYKDQAMAALRVARAGLLPPLPSVPTPSAVDLPEAVCGQVHDGEVCTEQRVPGANGCWAHYGPEASAPPAAASADTTPRVWSGPDPGADRALLIDAVRYVVKGRRAAAYLVQRKVRVGFAKAMRLMDLMESWGVVSPRTSKADRVVLAPTEAVEDIVAAISAVLPNTEQEGQ